MYLSRVEVNTARRAAGRLLNSPQVMHAAVLASFPADRSAGRVLWRVDRAPLRTVLYVVSPDRADFTHLVEQAGWPAAGEPASSWQTRDYGPVLDGLSAGQRYSFRLCANPTHAVRLRADRPRTQRVGHVTAAQQLAWLVSRADRWGFAVRSPGAESDEPTVRVSSRHVWTFRHQTARMTLATATYDGELTVQDPMALRRALSEGIGPAKAYGCGLMTLAPLVRR